MEIIEALKEMKDKIYKIGKAPVLFIGSGLSKRYYNTPDWKTLLEMVADKVGINKDEIQKWGSYEKIATELEYHCFASEKPQYDKGEDRRYPLRKIIKQIIEEKDVITEDKKHELSELANIIPTAIITTNYDELLKNTFGESYKVCVGQDIIFSSRDNHFKTIYKIHGCVSEPSSIVITQEDYDEFMANSKYLYAKLMTLFWENPIVFMGYSISDENVKNVLDTMLEVMTNEQKRNFEQRVWVLAYADEGVESFEEIEIITGKNKAHIKRFCLDNSYGEFYKTLSDATCDIQEKDLKFTISENAIDLLIKPLYQKQDKFQVVVRELLQNATDACKKANKPIKVTIGVNVEENNAKLEVEDYGIGMDLNDIVNYFLTIGESSKNKDDDGLTGKFGIGILSIFLIGKEAKVYSKKESSMHLGIRIFQSNNEKKVEKIEVDEAVFKDGKATILEVNIDDEQIVNHLKAAKKIEDVIPILGLDNFCVWDDSKIIITFNKTQETKVIEKLDVSGMSMVNNNLYIDKMYDEDKKRRYANKTALINDMVVRVTLGSETSDMMKNVDIPFFATRTGRNLYGESVIPNLSRSEVEIDGKLKDDIITYVYEEEANKLISGIKEQLESGKTSALDLKWNVIENCRGLRNQNVTYKNKTVVISESSKDVIQVYGSQELFSKLVENEECDYCRYEINKSKLGDMIEIEDVIGIGIDYLDKYICHATGSYNGFRMQVIKKLLDKLKITSVQISYDNATNMWASIIKQKEKLEKEFNACAQNGIICFEEEYKPMIADMKTYNNVLIFKERKSCVDIKFIKILKKKLMNENCIAKYLVLK